MKTIKLTLIISLISFAAFAQVGVGNTDPKATLDVTASNVATPSNEDGILIPRIDNFPTVNPTADQDGMMVFVTGNGTPAKGFYYWDDGSNSWNIINSIEDADWYETNTTSAPNDIYDNIFTQGGVAIGASIVSNSKLFVLDNDNTHDHGINLSRTINTSTGGNYRGLNSILNASGSGFALYNSVDAELRGTVNNSSNAVSASAFSLTANGSVDLIGGSFIDIAGNAPLYAANFNYATGSTNTGAKYGYRIVIPNSLNGVHYGIHSDVQNSTGYAAYFRGRTSFGQGISNRYILPATDGTNGQVMTTDGAGNVTFSDLPSITDTDTQNTLDQAYDEGGAGAGKDITADTGAVTINGTDGLLVTGTFGSGNTIDDEITGDGIRMFFNPRKAAYRSGMAENDWWIDSRIGDYSFSHGRQTWVPGEYSVAFGRETTAAGDHAFAGGYDSDAGGDRAFVYGLDSQAAGNYGVAFGDGAQANGENSFAQGDSVISSNDFSFTSGQYNYVYADHAKAIGQNLSAESYNEIVLGMYDTNYSENSSTAFDANDRLFVVGNGTSSSARSNALTIYKSGLMNINDEYNMPLTDGTSGQVMTTDGAGNVTFADVSTGTERINDLIDGKSDFDGSQNGSSIFLGISAGQLDDGTNNKNIGIGKNTLSSNVIGTDNIAIGHNALYTNNGSTGTFSLQGNGNVALGTDALYNNFDGSNNIGIGVSSLRNNDGSSNIALGYQALNSNTTGNSNIAFGSNSLSNNTSGADNIAIGSNSQENIRGDNNIGIGRFTLRQGTSVDNNIAIGENALENISYSNLSNTGSWNIALGYRAMINTANSEHNVMIGYDAGFDSNGDRNVGLGYGVLQNVTGFANIALGDETLHTLGDGDYNVALGYHAGHDTTNGDDNVFIGHQAGLGNTTGSNNVYIGNDAGDGQTTGSNNIFIGSNAGSFFSDTSSNILAIDNTPTGITRPLVYGEFDNNILRVNGYLQVRDPSSTGYVFPLTDGTNGQVLTTDGTGNVIFQDLPTFTDTDEQNLSSNVVTANEEVEIAITNGTNTTINIQDADANASNELITLATLNGTDLEITEAGSTTTVDLSSLDQSATVTANNTAISNNTTAINNHIASDADTVIGNEVITAATLNGTDLEITEAGSTTTVDLSSLNESGTDEQDLSSNVVTANEEIEIAITNGTNTTINIQDADANATNELITAATLSGTDLEITEAGSTTTVDLSSLNDSGTDDQNIQNLSISGSNILTVGIENGGSGTVDLSSLNQSAGVSANTTAIANHIANDADTALTNEIITAATLNGTDLEITEAGNTTTVDLSSLNPQKAMARILMSTSQTNTGAGTTKVNFDTRDFDIGGNFSLVNDNYVVPADGLYRVTAQVTADNSTGTGIFSVRIRVGGSQVRRAEFNHHGNGQVVRQVTSVLNLTAGQTIDVAFARPAVGATILANGGLTFFEIEQL